MNDFLAAFLPLFVAINVPGILPIFLSLTEGWSPTARRRLAGRALLTAFVLALLILFAGQLIFRVLGITVNDLRVGGGLILLVLSISDLLFGDFRRRDPALAREGDETLGIVPIGTPLIVGPAAITTILVSQQSYGYLSTLSSLLVNLCFVLVVFWFATASAHFVGRSASKAVAKVASLFLAAISVAMIRAGVLGMIAVEAGR